MDTNGDEVVEEVLQPILTEQELDGLKKGEEEVSPLGNEHPIEVRYQLLLSSCNGDTGLLSRRLFENSLLLENNIENMRGKISSMIEGGKNVIPNLNKGSVCVVVAKDSSKYKKLIHRARESLMNGKPLYILLDAEDTAYVVKRNQIRVKSMRKAGGNEDE